MSRPIVVGDRVRVRPECLEQERAEEFSGPPFGRVKEIEEDGALALLDGEVEYNDFGSDNNRWASLGSLERIDEFTEPETRRAQIAPSIALPDDPTRIARALRLLDACEWHDANLPTSMRRLVIIYDAGAQEWAMIDGLRVLRADSIGDLMIALAAERRK